MLSSWSSTLATHIDRSKCLRRRARALRAYTSSAVAPELAFLISLVSLLAAPHHHQLFYSLLHLTHTHHYSHRIHILLLCTRFMETHSYGDGWWMKVPYTANNLHYRGHSHKSWTSVLEELRRIKNSNPPLRHMFPYMLLQPKVPNNRECKVIMHNGAPKYFHLLGESNISPKVGSPEGLRMFTFAKQARDKLAALCPHAIMDGLVRIDIMVLPGDVLVVTRLRE